MLFLKLGEEMVMERTTLSGQSLAVAIVLLLVAQSRNVNSDCPTRAGALPMRHSQSARKLVQLQ